MRIGIDASNLRAGGGVTHLVELLQAAEPEEQGIAEVVVWGGRETLARLPVRKWLRPVPDPLLDGPLPARIYWQQAKLTGSAASCDLLFVPGGTYAGSFRPFVAMSQNLLPFDEAAASLYGWSWTRARLAILRRSQSATFRAASGVIFLTGAARAAVLRSTGELPGRTTVIPHGVSPGCGRAEVAQRPVSAFSPERPFRWLYVSTVDVYKHQDVVAEAVARLRAEGRPVALDLVGPAYGPALRELQRVLERTDPDSRFIRYHGAVPRSQVADCYGAADGFVFASSCETFGIVLLDAMAAGLPVAASRNGVTRDVLGEAGAYFEPRDPDSMADVLRALLESPERRTELAARARERARGYTWEGCARRTMAFLAEVGRSHAAGGRPALRPARIS